VAAAAASQTADADALLGVPMKRAGALAGCTEGLDEETEEAVVDVIDEAKRRPLGRDQALPDAKG